MADESSKGGLLLILMSVLGTIPSGGDRMAMELARRWPRTAGPVTVLTTREGAKHIRDLGIVNVKVELVAAVGTSARSTSLAYLMRIVSLPMAVWQTTRRTRPRIVLSASAFPPDLLASLIARSLGAKWVQSWQLEIPAPRSRYDLSIRSWSWPRLADAGRVWGLLRQSLSYASQQGTLQLTRRFGMKLVVPTRLMAAAAERYGVAMHQIHIANYGIDAIRDGALEARQCVGRSVPYDAIFVGRFHAQKGLDDLIAVWKLVLRQIPGARLVVIGAGTGAAAAEFTRQLGELDPGSVTLQGVQTGRDKYVVMAQSRVFLFPSHHESWGLVALEAMAAGLPVVGYDLPSSREAFGNAMLQVESYDVDAFAAAVLRLLEDETSRNVYRQRGYRIAERYNWDKIAKVFAQDVIASAQGQTFASRSIS